MQKPKFSIVIIVCDLFNFYYLLCIVLFSQFIFYSSANELPKCTANDFKYDFTDCDAYGGRWRVSVPASPDQCTGGSPDAPIRVNKCYTSCEGGQFFNMTSLLCENCDSGHYSLGGGVTIDSFNNSLGQLPNGFHIITESTKHTTKLNKNCNGWYVDSTTNHLVSSMQSISLDNDANSKMSDFGSGCVSIVTYTVKVVKSGRLRFTYHYQIPDDISSSLLFTFHYRLYANGDESSGTDDDSNSNIRFPLPTVDQNYETVEVAFSKPGIYIFTWKSVLIGNLRGMLNINRSPSYASGQFGHFDTNSEDNKDDDLSTKKSHDFFQNRLSSVGLIRIKKISIEGIAYASECTRCEPGTYAPNSGMRECLPCLPDTAYDDSGATKCYPCNLLTEYSYRGSTQCLKRPVCGVNDFYQVPKGKCNSNLNQQEVEFKWIEPRICVDQNHIFPSHKQFINCTISSTYSSNQCDLGMELRQEGISEFCQFCPRTYFRDEKSPRCQPCPPFSSPYYAISVVYWNNSLPAWSTAHIGKNISSVLSEDYFSDNHNYLNAYFSRQCIRSDDDTGYDSDSSRINSRYNYLKDGNVANENEVSVSTNEDCNSRISWQPFHDYIRTGASTILDSYLILSITIPGFRSIGGGEISFVYEIVCSDGDRCVFLFVQTNNEESDLQLQEWNNNIANEYKNRKKFSSLSHQSLNTVIKEWGQSSDGRQSFRYQVEQNISVTFSWVFKRSTSFQSYAKLHSLSITNSVMGAAIRCKSCPVLSQSSPNCITCPNGEFLENLSSSSTVVHSNDDDNKSQIVQSKYHCKSCPPNHILNTSIVLPLGVESCIPCGSNLITDNQTNTCYSDCSVQFGDETYDLGELHQPLLYRGGNMFTAGGTQYMHLFKISLCGHTKRSILSTCLNNITAFSDESAVSSGVRSYICRSTIIPDGSQTFATQSVSLGDELIGISRDSTINNITVHNEFLRTNSWRTNQISNDFHLFYSTKSATSACPNGRTLTVTMRCSPEVEKNSPGKAVISPPKSCPDGTCDGCNFHLLIESGMAATCRICRPYSDDYETVIGECVDGVQQVHYLNPKGCVIKQRHNLDNKIQDTIQRPCSVLLPRQVQIGIALAIALGLMLLLLVFHFWNKNRSLEYKYTKLIESAGDSKGGDDLSFDNCCAEDQDEEDEPSVNNDSVTSNNQLIFDNHLNKTDLNSSKETQYKKANNRLEKSKNSAKSMFGSSREMQQLFGKSSSPLLGGGGGNHGIDDEGYETIRLTSAPDNNNDSNQIV